MVAIQSGSLHKTAVMRQDAPQADFSDVPASAGYRDAVTGSSDIEQRKGGG
ncbi:hypothetical protein J14TS5_58320 [Paenibacillus lautus]|nr:hypothetical protein J14TS5_58320 [Paenibacillus lautus]